MLRVFRSLRGRFRFRPSLGYGPAKVEINEGDRRVLLRLIAQLGNRRVLYDPVALENRDHVGRSILAMRGELSAALGELGERSKARTPVQRMLDASGAFQTAEPQLGTSTYVEALGWLRGMIGAQLSELSEDYGLHVEGRLSSLLVRYEPNGEPLPYQPAVADLGCPEGVSVIALRRI